MDILLSVVVVIHVIAALGIIGLVLLQHGKGADMGAAFGSGASGSLFGATGSANFMSRSTAVCAAIFFACTLALAYFANDRSRPASGSVLDQPTVSAPAASVPLAGASQATVAASAAATAAAPSAAAVTASGAGAVPTK